jgi:hypothetical protein
MAMADDFSRDILVGEGFRPVGQIFEPWMVSLWWHEPRHVETIVLEIDRWLLVRASKLYRVTGKGPDGETCSRHLEEFDEFLTTHFSQLDSWCSFLRTITPTMAKRQMTEKQELPADPQSAPTPLAAQLAQLTERFEAARTALAGDEQLLQLGGNRSSLLSGHLNRQIPARRRELQEIQAQAKMVRDRLHVDQHLERQYLAKGQGVCLLVAAASNIQVVQDAAQFTDALHAVVKECDDLDRYQVRQKLGAKLQIAVEDIAAPGVAALTRWTGAALDPNQLARLGPEFAPLREAVERQYAIFLRQDITAPNGAVQDEKKLVAARVLRNFLNKIATVPAVAPQTTKLPAGPMGVWIGLTSGENQASASPVELPLPLLGNVLFTGRTGSGKTFATRAWIEGVLGYSDASVLIIDPGNQWFGIRQAEDRAEILGLYERFGLEPNQARGFDFTYYCPGLQLGEPLPADLRELAFGRRVVSLKGLSDRERCRHTQRILEAAFDERSRAESTSKKLIIGLDEAHRFLRRYTDREAHDEAAAVQRAIDRLAREGRKYGVTLWLITQGAMDLSHEVASVRPNIATRVFLASSDNQIAAAADFMDHPEQLLHLAPGQALVCNASWGMVAVDTRPPLSKVLELDEQEIRSLLGSAPAVPTPLSPAAQAVLNRATEHLRDAAAPPRLSILAKELQITSRRQLDQIVLELRGAAAARFERLNEPGRPLIIIPSALSETGTNSAHNPALNSAQRTPCAGSPDPK